MDLDVQVAKLKLMRSSHQSNCYEMEDRVIKFYPTEIKKTEERIIGLKADLETIKLHPMTTIVESKNEDGAVGAVISEDNFKIQIGGITHTERKTAGEAIIAACKQIKNPDEQVDLGEYRGFKMKLFMDSGKFKIALKGHTTQIAELENSVTGNVSRVANLLDGFEGKIANLEARCATLQTEMKSADEESKRPFPKESEYQEKSARLVQLNKELDNTGKEKKSKDKEVETTDKKPSVLEKLKTIGTIDKSENALSKEQKHDKGSIAI